MIRKNSHLRIARYHQHLHELLDLDVSPLQYMLKSFPDVKEPEEMRKIIGRYGLTGRQQVNGRDKKQKIFDEYNSSKIREIVSVHTDLSHQAAE